MTFSITTYNSARKVAGPCAAFRAATGRGGPAPLQLFSTPRRRRRLLRSMQRSFLTLAFFAVSALSAGVITAFLPSPY